MLEWTMHGETHLLPLADITNIEPIHLIDVDMEYYGWRYSELIPASARESHVETFVRGDERLGLAWSWSQDPNNHTIYLHSPIYINDTAWPVSSSRDVAEALDEDRRLAQPLPGIYDTTPRLHTPAELTRFREELAEYIAEVRSELHEPTTGVDGVDAGRPRTLDLDPNLPPWEMDHDGVVFDGSPQPQVLEPGDPDWPPWLSTAPLWDSPSLEESFNSDAMVVDRNGGSGREVPESQRFAAMDPEQVEAARGLLRDYPDAVPWGEVGRRGLTLDDVSLVYAADVGDLPDVTTTDPWRSPAAAPWQPATMAPDTGHEDPRRDLERAAGAGDVVAEFGGETTVERLGLDTDGIGEAPEAAGAEPAGLRGYTIGDLTAALRHGDPWTWGNTALLPPGTPEPRPRVMPVILPDGRTAYMDGPAPTAPEQWYSPDTMRVERGGEVPASQRFAAMDPEQVQAARGVLRDYPDTVPFDEVGRRGLTLEDVSLVYAADIGDLPDVTSTDPWRAPAAALWLPATTAPDPHHDLQRGPERAASAADVVPERGSETTPERPGPATDATGGDPEITGIRTALERLVDGQITDDDLARIGLTPEQAARLVSADVHADIDHAAGQHRAEPAADAESATTHALPDREYVDPVYASLTEEDHEANRRAAYDAWTNTVRREWAERARAASNPGPSPAAQDSAGSQRWFDVGWASAVADEPGLENTTAGDDVVASEGRPVASASDEASALNNDGDHPYVGFGRDVIDDDIGDDIAGGRVAYPVDPSAPDGERGVQRLRLSDRASRQVIPDHPAADPLDRLQDRIDRLHDRLNDIQQTIHNPARERAPTGGASTDAPTHRGRHVSPDISDGLDPPYGYPADTPSTDLADPRYQQSEIDPGPNMEL